MSDPTPVESPTPDATPDAAETPLDRLQAARVRSAGRVGGGGATPVDAARSSLRVLRDVLEDLAPPEGVEVEDAAGRRYRVPGAIPARRQIAALVPLERLLDLPAVAGAWAQDGEDLLGTVARVVRAVATPDVVDLLDDAFGTAYPDVIAAARAAAGATDARPSDLFPVEELAIGLVPFCVRAARRLATVVTGTRA